MYKSPIDLLIADVQNQILRQQDEQIFQAVVSVGVNVDKDELIRALKYDRGQYEKGLQEGLAAATPKWISASDRLPEPNQAVLCIGARGGMFISNKWRSDHNATPGFIWVNGSGWKGFTHWMPLPEPPKEEKHG